MVSSPLCPAVHILGSQNVYCRAEGIADHNWPWAIFLDASSHLIKRFCLGKSFGHNVHCANHCHNDVKCHHIDKPRHYIIRQIPPWLRLTPMKLRLGNTLNWHHFFSDWFVHSLHMFPLWIIMASLWKCFYFSRLSPLYSNAINVYFFSSISTTMRFCP